VHRQFRSTERVRGTNECDKPATSPLSLSLSLSLSPPFSSLVRLPYSPRYPRPHAHMCAGHEVALLAVRREALAWSPPPRWHRGATLPLLHVARAAMPAPVCEWWGAALPYRPCPRHRRTDERTNERTSEHTNANVRFSLRPAISLMYHSSWFFARLSMFFFLSHYPIIRFSSDIGRFIFPFLPFRLSLMKRCALKVRGISVMMHLTDSALPTLRAAHTTTRHQCQTMRLRTDLTRAQRWRRSQ